MTGALTLAAIVAAVAFSRRRKGGDPVQPKPVDRDAEMVAVIRDAAAKHNVPPHVALAFADVESGFNPYAEGDKGWSTNDGGAKYRRLVRDNPKFLGNAARMQPDLWHSYGLFQLLAPYHTRFNENPRVLLDPGTNADRGVATIKRLLAEYGGDPVLARIAYVCGSLKCGAEKRAQIEARIRPALARWQ